MKAAFHLLTIGYVQLVLEFSKQVKESLSTLITQLQAGLHHVKGSDFSVYTGQTGEGLYSSLAKQNFKASL